MDDELDRRHPERVQLRNVRTLEDFQAMWSTLEQLWSGAIERARRLPESARQERVDGEWSFVETMRHMVFATDAWVSRTVLDDAMPYHPLGCAHSDFPATDSIAIGLDVDARPSFDEVMAVRAEHMTVVRSALDGLNDDDLDRRCTRAPTPDFADERPTVKECLETVMTEECEHYRYATRDLAALEART
ncbi:MAG: DinB family protein [Actinomycetota bacterium]|nr:DinB family protein [Actinomycetota bacterium]